MLPKLSCKTCIWYVDCIFDNGADILCGDYSPLLSDLLDDALIEIRIEAEREDFAEEWMTYIDEEAE